MPREKSLKGLFSGRESFVGARVPVAVGGGHDPARLPRGDALGKAGLVQHHAQFFLDGAAVCIHVAAKHAHRAAVPFEHAQQEFDHSGLARAVLPHQPHHAALGQRQGYAVEGEIPIVFGKVCEFHSVHTVSSPERTS